MGDISCGLVGGMGVLRSPGGRRHGDYLASVEVYDPATGEWSDVKHPVPEGLDAEGRDVYELDRVEQASERWTRLQIIWDPNQIACDMNPMHLTHLSHSHE